MNDLIAKTVVRSVSPIGGQLVADMGIAAPIRQRTGEYACVVVLPPDYEAKTVFGEDSLQALSLALRFAADRLNQLVAEGWKFFYPDTNHEVPLGAYFVHPEWISRLEAIGREAEHAIKAMASQAEQDAP